MTRAWGAAVAALVMVAGCGQDEPEVDRKADRASMQETVEAVFSGKVAEVCAALSDALDKAVHDDDDCRDVAQDRKDDVRTKLSEVEYGDRARARLVVEDGSSKIEGRVRFVREGDRMLLDGLDADFVVSQLDARYVPSMRAFLQGRDAYKGKRAAVDAVLGCLPDEILAASERDLRRAGQGLLRGDREGLGEVVRAMNTSMFACEARTRPGQQSLAEQFAEDRWLERKARLVEEHGKASPAAEWTVRLCFTATAAPPDKHAEIAKAMVESSVMGEISHGDELDGIWSKGTGTCEEVADEVWKK